MRNSEASIKSRDGCNRAGFTLVELLVVIGIIGLLVAILLPSLSKARRAAQEVQCMSGLRQWGQGFYMYCDSNKGMLPCDGPDGSDTGSNLIGPPNGVNTGPGAPKLTGIDDPSLWYNAIPPRINSKSYYDMIETNVSSPGSLPHAGSNSIFVCPGAWDIASETSTEVSGDYFNCNCVDPAFSKTAKVLRPEYMSYVFNSKLFGTDNAGVGHYAWKLSQLRPSSNSVLMTEKMSNFGEYKDPIVQQKVAQWPSGFSTPKINSTGYTSTFGQMKANWTRFAARHRHGGFLLYADGHVEWHRWDELQPSASTPTTPYVDDNIQGVAIWNPLGPV